MIFSLTFKTPDVVYNTASELAAQALAQARADFPDNPDLQTKEDERYFLEDKVEETEAFLEKWIEWNECVTLEFDTEKGTAVVVPRKSR